MAEKNENEWIRLESNKWLFNMGCKLSRTSLEAPMKNACNAIVVNFANFPSGMANLPCKAGKLLPASKIDVINFTERSMKGKSSKSSETSSRSNGNIEKTTKKNVIKTIWSSTINILLIAISINSLMWLWKRGEFLRPIKEAEITVQPCSATHSASVTIMHWKPNSK